MTYRSFDQGGKSPPHPPHKEREDEPDFSIWYRGKLKDGYFDNEKKTIKADLLIDIPIQVAKRFGEAGVTSTQLRRFFTHVRSAERELWNKQFPDIVPKLQMLQPMAANYVGRGKNKYERESREIFKSFIDRNIELATESKKSFEEGFIPHFESVLAYFKYYCPNK